MAAISQIIETFLSPNLFNKDSAVILPKKAPTNKQLANIPNNSIINIKLYYIKQ